jgi:hypothetical protein
MQKQIKVWKTTEIVTILSSTEAGTYRIIWHRTDGEPHVEFHVTPEQDESVEDAVAKDLRARLGP